MGLLNKKEQKPPKEKKPKKKKGKKEEQQNPANEALQSAQTAQPAQTQAVQGQPAQTQTVQGQQPVDQNLQQQQAPGAPLQQQANMMGYTTENNWINESRQYGDQAMMQQDPNASANGMPQDSVADPNKEKKKVENKRFKYTIINSMGKKEKGNFDAESEEDVRNFLLSQDYKVLEVEEFLWQLK